MAQSLSQQLKRIKAAEGLIVTPRIDRWLLDHPEGVVTREDWQRDLLLRLTSDESNSQRTARLGSSNRGMCLRQQVFRFIGMPGLRSGDSMLQNIFNDGTWRHIRWQMMGMIAGVFTDVEVKYGLPAYNLGTSLDAENSAEEWIFELKGMRYYGRVVAGDYPMGHLLQMHTAMLAANADRTIYVVEDKGSNDWKEVTIRRDPKIISQVKDELNAATDSIEDEKLPPVITACKAHKGDDYRNCPFRTTCLDQVEWPENRTWGTPVSVGRHNGQPGRLAGGARANAGRAAGTKPTTRGRRGANPSGSS